MIVGVTLIAFVITTFAFLVLANKNGKMSSYVWGLLGYGQNEQKPEAVTAKELGASYVVDERVSGEKASEMAVLEDARPRSSQSEDCGDSTPKAQPKANGVLPPVPSFTLQEHQDEEDSEGEDNLPPPSFPAMNSAQRAGAMPAPRIPTLNPPSNGAANGNGFMAPPPQPGGLMAPPSRPVPSLRSTPQTNTAAGSRVPTNGPLPNRNPTSSTNSLSTLSATATKTPNPRQKVLLKPGHSPLDWANLKKSGQNLAGVDRLIRVTPSLLKSQNGRKGKPAWSSYQGKVYNMTPYLPYHPGGEGELRRAAGKDGGKLFHEVHPWVNWENMLEGCLVGIMVSEGDGEKESDLDDMD